MRKKIEAVTTFSPAGYAVYGKRFVETWLRHWPVPLTVYYEDGQEVDVFHERLTWKRLDADRDRQAFLEYCRAHPETIGTAADPNSQSVRFCHKVFALTGHVPEPGTEWLLWVDADVWSHRDVDDAALERMCPEDASVVALFRPHYLYTECGFVGYRVGEQRVRSMLEDMRRYYTTRELFTRPKKDWHDSRCFDLCLSRSGIPATRQRNLVGKIDRPVTHVWPYSVLAPYTTHAKGPKRKKAAYGRAVE